MDNPENVVLVESSTVLERDIIVVNSSFDSFIFLPELVRGDDSKNSSNKIFKVPAHEQKSSNTALSVSLSKILFVTTSSSKE